MTAFMIGDRVRLKPNSADTWIDPKLALRARRLTPATVKIVIGTALSDREKSYRIDFDSVGRMKTMSEIIPFRELEKIDDGKS